MAHAIFKNYVQQLRDRFRVRIEKKPGSRGVIYIYHDGKRQGEARQTDMSVIRVYAT
jgi:hypothetical protein